MAIVSALNGMVSVILSYQVRGRPIEEENNIHIQFLVVVDGRLVSEEPHDITISKLSTVLDWYASSQLSLTI